MLNPNIKILNPKQMRNPKSKCQTNLKEHVLAGDASITIIILAFTSLEANTKTKEDRFDIMHIRFFWIFPAMRDGF